MEQRSPQGSGTGEFDGIYREFHPKIHRYLSNLASPEEARDLTQVDFLKISRSLDGFRGESSQATWIYRIATNTARDHATSSSIRQQCAEQLCGGDCSIDDIPDTDTTLADHEYARREMRACIRGVVDQLPENYRVPLLLSEFEDVSNPQIADMLGISVDTVKIRLHRARTSLRNAMESQCCFYHDERSELMCDRKA